MVFADKGYVDDGAYGVQYDLEQFYDPPPKRHGNGQPTSFADGHCEYRKWTDKRTIDMTWANKGDPQPCNQDLYWLQKVIWGKFGFTPSCPPE
jgi:prepilin-type processing-associated H-X9-DG protein